MLLDALQLECLLFQVAFDAQPVFGLAGVKTFEFLRDLRERIGGGAEAVDGFGRGLHCFDGGICGGGTGSGDALIQREAAAMTRDYTGALAQMDAQAKASADYAPALHALDQSAAEIRHAIATDPQARFLLEQLRRTYARRLALTQRAVMT